MSSEAKFFKKSKALPVDKFIENVLYDNKVGYYNSKFPFGNKGDFVTAPTISRLYSEMIAIWMVSTWEIFGKPKNFNIVELGPGDGSFIKILLDVSKKFPKFNSSKNIYLYETSNFLKKVQKKTIKNNKIKWIENFKKIDNGPVIFFGNEFFDAIPIKQFKVQDNTLNEKFFILEKNNKIKESFRNAKKNDIKNIKSFKILNNLKFIEFPKSGLKELEKIIQTISRLSGCILMVDYGYLKPNNKDTIQSVIKNKKNKLLNNLGKADITAHVNFSLLNEFFLKKNLSVKKIISQRDFLNNMGIMQRADIIARKMQFREKTNLYLRLKRLLSPKLMGELFKVILAYDFKKKDYFGFN